MERQVAVLLMDSYPEMAASQPIPLLNPSLKKGTLVSLPDGSQPSLLEFIIRENW
jgi:hypothetical protein